MPSNTQPGLLASTATLEPPGSLTLGPTDLFITQVMATKYAARTQYAALPTETPTPMIPLISPDCGVADLQATYGVTASGQHIVLFINMKNIGKSACFLPELPIVQLRNQAGEKLAVTYEYITKNAAPSGMPPTQVGAPGQPNRYGLAIAHSAQFFLTWGNWCAGEVKGSVILRVTLLNVTDWLDIHTDLGGGGYCDDASSISDIAVFGFGY